MKILMILSLLYASLAMSQELEDIRFIETSDSINTPFSLPIDIDMSGRISILKDNIQGRFSLNPLAQFNYSRTTINYVAPIISKQFELVEPLSHNKWIEVKTKKLEVGIGPSTELAETLSLGLTVYRGAMQTTVKFKTQKEEVKEKFSLKFTMPKRLSEMEEWSDRDLGVYQTYGGVQAHASLGIGMVNIGSGSFAIQNKFLVSVKKLSSSLVEVKISEEGLKKRQITLGPIPARIYSTGYKGKIFSSTFVFDMSLAEHHELYRLAIKGRLDKLQDKLPADKQKIEWKGDESSYYAGIPWVVGKSQTEGHYDMEFDEEDSEVELVRTENKGLLLPLRNHTRIVWNRNDVMTLFWSSEMKKAKGATLEKKFFSIGRTMGIEGFDDRPELNAKLGSSITQIGLGFTRSDIEKLTMNKVSELESALKERCETQQLSCRKDKKLRKLVENVQRIIKLPWLKKRSELGLLITKEPVIVYGLTKALKLKKEVFFKFLSENYQSIQGVTVIGF